MKVEFRVDGHLPPKKRGELSMWGQEVEARRLVALRKAALEAMGGKPPLRVEISLDLVVNVGPANQRWTGDLDNFVTGLCDGLMAADDRAHLHALWSELEHEELDPGKVIAIVDDSQVVEIRARKLAGQGDDPWYEVVLQGEQ